MGQGKWSEYFLDGNEWLWPVPRGRTHTVAVPQELVPVSPSASYLWVAWRRAYYLADQEEVPLASTQARRPRLWPVLQRPSAKTHVEQTTLHDARAVPSALGGSRNRHSGY